MGGFVSFFLATPSCKILYIFVTVYDYVDHVFYPSGNRSINFLFNNCAVNLHLQFLYA